MTCNSRYREWTVDDNELLRKLINNKVPYADIAIQLFRTLAAVQNQSAKLGLRSKRPSNVQPIMEKPTYRTPSLPSIPPSRNSGEHK